MTFKYTVDFFVLDLRKRNLGKLFSKFWNIKFLNFLLHIVLWKRSLIHDKKHLHYILVVYIGMWGCVGVCVGSVGCVRHDWGWCVELDGTWLVVDVGAYWVAVWNAFDHLPPINKHIFLF